VPLNALQLHVPGPHNNPTYQIVSSMHLRGYLGTQAEVDGEPSAAQAHPGAIRLLCLGPHVGTTDGIVLSVRLRPHKASWINGDGVQAGA
jgi:hypothetical protein